MEQVSSGTKEVVARPERRRFTAEYKLKIIRQAEACKTKEEVGALLRREGLYSSLLSTWKAAARKGALKSLVQKRGRKQIHSESELELASANREIKRLRAELRRAEAVIGVQKKVSEILGIQFPDETEETK